MELRSVFPPQIRAQVTAIACSLPKQHQIPLTRWSSTELARYVSEDPSLPPISPSTVRRWLQAERIRPWRYHSWQHIHDPAAFLQRARPVLQTYAQAHALLREGTWPISLDEKTSIQARENEAPLRPAVPGKPVLQEARYHRRGACHLFAGLSVADGKVYGLCRERKRFVDFQSFVIQVILPEALHRGIQTVRIILDNGTTHAPKQLENWLETLAGVCDLRLRFQIQWLPPRASWLDQIEIWFSILQRKCLQPNHFFSTDQLEQSILDFMASYNQAAKPITWSYTAEKLERKLGVQMEPRCPLQDQPQFAESLSQVIQ